MSTRTNKQEKTGPQSRHESGSATGLKGSSNGEGKARSSRSDDAFTRIYQDAQEHTKSGVLRGIFDHSKK